MTQNTEPKYIQTKNKERRSYYRINDMVGLTYRVIGTPKDMLPHSSDSLGLSLTDLLNEIDHEFNNLTNILWHENPVVAKAFGLLNKKLSIIAAHSLQRNEEQVIASYEEMLVNISGCGMSFHSTEPITTGTQLMLSIVLKPSNVLLDIKSQVISCEKQSDTNSDKPYMIRVSFTDSDTAQEQMIQHVVQKQCAQLGEVHKERTEEN